MRKVQNRNFIQRPAMGPSRKVKKGRMVTRRAGSNRHPK